MKAIRLAQLPEKHRIRLMHCLPFFRQVLNNNLQQANTLSHYSRIFALKPGEIITRAGDFDSWVYAPLRGQLLVHPGDPEKTGVIGCISPGELFGTIALLNNCIRTATVVADNNCREVILLAMDCAPLGETDDFSRLNMATKTIFYRMVCRVLRKRLLSYCIDYPNNDLVESMPGMEEWNGDANTLDELHFWYDACMITASALCQWNDFFSRHPPAEGLLWHASEKMFKKLFDGISSH